MTILKEFIATILFAILFAELALIYVILG